MCFMLTLDSTRMNDMTKSRRNENENKIIARDDLNKKDTNVFSIMMNGENI